jgi:hypothetical protein
VQSLNKVQKQRQDSVGRFCTVRQCSMQNHIGLFGYAFSSNQQRRKSEREKTKERQKLLPDCGSVFESDVT